MVNKENFSTKDYFISAGFKEYKSIDINGAYESFQFDLNKDILKTYKFNKTYDLVINTALENMFSINILYF